MTTFLSTRPTFARTRGVVQYIFDGRPLRLRVDQDDRIEASISAQRTDGTIGRAYLDLAVRGGLVKPFEAAATTGGAR